MKRKLINIISNLMPELVRPLLREGQGFITAGGFDCTDFKDTARCVRRTGADDFWDGPDDAYRGNHAEADTRVWLHARVSSCRTVTIYSPDSDVTMVELLTCSQWGGGWLGQEKQAFVQIRRPDGKDNLVPDVIDVSLLAQRLQEFEPLVAIPVERRVDSVVSLFVLTGCDFVSFFYKLPQARIFENLCKEAEFVSGVTGSTLGDWPRQGTPSGGGGGEGESEGGVPPTGARAVLPGLSGSLGAFLKLFGVTYFHKYKARFPKATAARSFSSVCETANTSLQSIERWLEHLREQTWAAVPSEDESLPSFGALYFHFLRGVFALKMWEQACTGLIAVPEVAAHGYRQVGESLQLVYDYEVRIDRIKEQVDAVLKGCGCKKSTCVNRQCKCRSASRACTPSCRCVGCANTEGGPQPAQHVSASTRPSRSLQPVILESPQNQASFTIPVEYEDASAHRSADELGGTGDNDDLEAEDE